MTSARPPGRDLAPARGAGSASHHRVPPSRSVLGLLAAGLLVFSLVLVVAPAALAEEEDGAWVSDGSTDTGATDTGGSSGLDGTGALAGDYGPGGYADGWGSSSPPGGSPPPGESTGSPSWAGGPAPTQHNGIPPGPAGLPTGLPGTPAPGSIPNVDTLGGVLCCPTSGPGGNTGNIGSQPTADYAPSTESSESE
jgi:hypothetical protein